MGECEYVELCHFFNDQLEGDHSQIDKMKETYCKHNNLNCARFMVVCTLGKEFLLPDLFPHEKIRAYELIAEKG